MTIPISQANRLLKATTPLGGDTLVAVSLTGEEELSRPFLYTVDFVSDDDAISAGEVLGKPMTLHIPLVDGDTRIVHGLVRRFQTAGRNQVDELARYRAEVVPALWFMSLSSDCRTFEEKSVLDIIEEVCKGAGVTDVERRVLATFESLPYVVQYGETDLAFVHRLLEGAGLYYMFEHEESKHTLVFSDHYGGLIPACVTESANVQQQLAGERPQTDVVFQLSREYAVNAASVSLVDHDLLRSDYKDKVSTKSSGARGERYAFLGDLNLVVVAGETKRRVVLEEARHDLFQGASNCAGFQSGTRVKVTGGSAGEKGMELHLVRVTHRIEVGDVLAGSGLGAQYENTFTAIPADVPYSPERSTPRPSVRGTQTAKIVGKGGTGEIDVDADGCVLLEFPWDRGAGKGGDSKHRVHVASVWSGTGWGFVQIPRIGQEVLVDFMEGDPDRPIITGRVYNHAHKFPYALPGDKTQTGWKSRTLGGGDDNFNEIRFEDKKGSEHIFSQAEKDLNVVVKNDETRDVRHDRTTTIKNNDTRTVTEGDDEHTIKKGKQTVTVSEGDQTIEVSKGKQTVTVKDDQTITVEQGNRKVTLKQGNDELKVQMGNLTTKVSMGDITIKADLGKIAIEAMQEVSIKVGSSSIVLSQTGVTIKGMMVKVEGMALTQVKAPMTQVNGDAMVMVKGGITMIN